MFKLYLYGIEIRNHPAHIKDASGFKLYLYGIEIKDVYGIYRVMLVQIVPLWN